MSVIDRFTRDEVSANIWWPLAVILAALCILTIPGENRAENQARADAADRASASATALMPALETVGFQPPSAGKADALLLAAQDRILQEEPSASQVRAWTTDGRLIFSTDPADQIGSAGALNDEQLTAATNDSAQVSIVTSTDLFGEPQPETFITYTPVADPAGTTVAIVQVDHPQSVLLDQVNAAWLGYRIVTAIFGLLVLLLAGLSLREPAARIGAGVPLTPEMVPAGQTLVDTDELVTLKESGTTAKRRVASMEDRVKVAEEERWKLEGQVQHLLSTAGIVAVPATAEMVTPAPRPVPTGRPTPGAQPVDVQAAEGSEPDVRVIPDAPIEAEPIAQADGAVPSRVEQEPAVEVPASDEVVRIPEPQRVSAGASGEESPIDILERFLGSEPPAQPADDPSVLRAQLARTADLKKPGSRERREQREREDPPV